MKLSSPFAGAALSAALFLGAAGSVLTPGVARAEAVRPEVGKPLQEAASDLKAQRYRDALAKVNEAEAVPNKTPNETYTIERMKFAVESAAGDAAGLAAALDQILASGRASAAEKIQMTEAVAVAYYRAKDYTRAAQWTERYFKEGGTEGSMHTVLIQSYYLAGDCSGVQHQVQGTESAGHAPTEEDLQLLANCYEQKKDKAGYASVMEQLVTYYPKREYWSDYISRTQSKPGFADRLDLDLYRMRFLTGNMTSANDYMEMAQLDLESGDPAEAKKVMDQGFANKVLGTGNEAVRQSRLRDLVNRSLADQLKKVDQLENDASSTDSGDGLVNLGLALVSAGQTDRGLSIIAKGMTKDSFKRPEDAKLHQGIAFVMAGKKGKARDILRSVRGTDGTADLAHMWLIYMGNAA